MIIINHENMENLVMTASIIDNIVLGQWS